MITYNDLYEILRKEKYSEVLQLLPKEFVEMVSEYLSDRKDQSAQGEDMFQDSVLKNKKQLENSILIFRELILRRKKKLLNLVFVANETGIMKRDYENMMTHEREVFDILVKTLEEGDKTLSRLLQGKKEKETKLNKMIIFNSNVDQFMDMSGKAMGPFLAGELANIDAGVSEVLVQGGKAKFVDE